MVRYRRWLILCLTVSLLSACGPKGVLKTPQGIPRKIVILQDDTALYDAVELQTQVKTTDQWDVWYIFDESGSHYMVGRDVQQYPEDPLYVHKDDVFEWNTFFCTTYRDSPHEAGRDPVLTYETLEGARTMDEDDVLLREKEVHDTKFAASDAHFILREHEGEIYHIAALYDDVDEDGNYVFLGHYAFGYQPYVPEATEFRRYVSKQQLAEQLRLLLGITGEFNADTNPSRVSQLYGPLISLFADWDDLDKGLDEIEDIFGAPELPQGAVAELAPDQFIDEIENLDPEVARIVDSILDYIENPENWDENNHAYVPVEWMEP